MIATLLFCQSDQPLFGLQILKENTSESETAMVVATLKCGAKAKPAAARLMPLLNKADTPLHLVYGRLFAFH